MHGRGVGDAVEEQIAGRAADDGLFPRHRGAYRRLCDRAFRDICRPSEKTDARPRKTRNGPRNHFAGTDGSFRRDHRRRRIALGRRRGAFFHARRRLTRRSGALCPSNLPLKSTEKYAIM